MDEQIHRFFDEEGTLSRSLPKYEFRHEQLDMALAIANGAREGETLLVEAGTGVGKSLAYLAPLILWAAHQSKRIFIATGTKTLQHQLLTKELPFLKKYLPVEFGYALCVGADNYLCERRLDALNPKSAAGLFENLDEIEALKDWAETCRDGLRSELDISVSPQTWYQACRIPELCSGQDCGKGGDCFYQRARRRMTKAEVLVGNHHLLFANMRADWEYLPHCHILVVDEAHHLDTVASDCLGTEFSHRAYRRVWEGLRGKEGAGCLIGSLTELGIEARQSLLDQVHETEQKFAETLSWFKEKVLEDRPRLTLDKETAILGLRHFLDPLEHLVASLNLAAGRIEDETKAIECDGYATRLERARKEAQNILDRPADDPWLLWVEALAPRGKSFAEATTAAFHSTPIEPGKILRDDLYSAFESTHLVSATLSVAGDFSHSRRRLGVEGEKTGELSLPSPFNTRENLLVYTPPKVSEPAQFETYIEDLSLEIKGLVDAAHGGTFVLCTSFKILEALYARFRDLTPTRGFFDLRGGRVRKKDSGPLLVLRQGEASREKLLGVFRKANKAILFGAATFWQGVDVPGRALEVVAITRLPFQVPDDPVLEAKIERCRRGGGNPFMEIQVPYAVTQFRQGLGRLIRSHTDRGVVAILDSRVVNKRYGEFFLNSLPDCEITQDAEEARAFLRETGLS